MKLKNNTYYTKPDIAVDLIGKIEMVVKIDSYDTILEPSAGLGVFVDIIKTKYPLKEIVALDKSPQNKHVIQADFLTYNTDHLHNKEILTIANPPFSPISLLNKCN